MKKLYKNYSILLSAIFFGLFFLFLGVITLPQYGVNWDEPEHFMRGQAYLHFFLTGKKNYNDLPKFNNYSQKENTIFFNPVGFKKNQVNRISLYQNNDYTFDYWQGKSMATHPPFNDIFAAFFNYVFFQKLGLLNDIDSYHLSYVFLSSLLLGIVVLWTSKKYSLIAGIIAGIALFTCPLFISESHYNIKDAPETVFYALTLIAFFEGYTKKSKRWILTSAIFCGFALSTKFNIVFIPFIVLPWIFLRIILKKEKVRSSLRLFPAFLVYPVISVGVLVASWPVLWSSPVRNLLASISYYKHLSAVTSFTDSRYLTVFGMNTYPIVWVGVTTPLITIILAISGIIYTLKKGKKEKHLLAVFVLIWFLLPILRVMQRGAGIYGGTRQIMEYTPALAILSGIGAEYIRSLLKKKKILNTLKHIGVFSVFICLFFFPVAMKLIAIHPNEGIYFNTLIGGLKGAKEKELPYWGETLGNPYRQGIIWMNTHAEKKAKLAISFGLASNIPKILLRKDIDYANGYRGRTNQTGEYVIGLTNKSIFDDTYFLKYLSRFLNPVYQVKIDGVPILIIWKNDRFHTRLGYDTEQEMQKPIISSKVATEITYDLGKIVTLRRAVFPVDTSFCKKNADDINVFLSTDGVRWRPAENKLGQQTVLEVGLFTNDHYEYFFAAEKARYIRINYQDVNSCLSSIKDITIYTL